MNQLEQQMARAADMAVERKGVSRHGIVANVDPNRGVRVLIDEGDPENGLPPTLTGWLPVGMTQVGPSVSMGCFPTPGTQVLMVPDMGDQSHMVVVAAVHSTQQPVQQITPYKGEAGPVVPGCPFWIMGANSIQLTPTGLMVRGPLFVDGDIVASGQVTAMDGASAVHLSTHTHTQDSDAHGDGEQPTNAPTPGS